MAFLDDAGVTVLTSQLKDKVEELAHDGCITLDTSAASGDDYDLTTILTKLGWLNDVIV